MGIEPTSLAWEAGILPMNYARINMIQYSIVFSAGQRFSLRNVGQEGEADRFAERIYRFRRNASLPGYTALRSSSSSMRSSWLYFAVRSARDGAPVLI